MFNENRAIAKIDGELYLVADNRTENSDSSEKPFSILGKVSETPDFSVEIDERGLAKDGEGNLYAVVDVGEFLLNKELKKQKEIQTEISKSDKLQEFKVGTTYEMPDNIKQTVIAVNK
jgi:hypothetical protein